MIAPSGQRKKRKYGLIEIISALLMISLSVTGSECEKLISNSGSIPPEMIGSWKLVEQTGALQDICLDEAVNYQQSGIALLTCPASETISRDFNVINDVLTYTQTSVSYSIETLNNTELYLTGRNVSRNLRYERIITDDSPYSSQNEDGSIKTGLNNSSEIVK